jgi:hypothetical protein
MAMRAGARNVVVYILTVVLIVAVAAAAVLIALQVRGDTPVRFDVSAAEGEECPAGEGTPACFRFTVTNVGNRPSRVRCDVTAEAGRRATFLGDSPVYTSSAPFEPGIAEVLIVKVDAGEEDTVTAPSMTCSAI